jgi:hypothetical protein
VIDDVGWPGEVRSITKFAGNGKERRLIYSAEDLVDIATTSTAIGSDPELDELSMYKRPRPGCSTIISLIALSPFSVFLLCLPPPSFIFHMPPSSVSLLCLPPPSFFYMPPSSVSLLYLSPPSFIFHMPPSSVSFLCVPPPSFIFHLPPSSISLLCPPLSLPTMSASLQ